MVSEEGKSRKLFLWGAGILALLFLIVWGIKSIIPKPTTTEPAIKLRYCGADLEELCVLSFGRDVDENLVVNLFVPDEDFPDFKLNIKTRAGESDYECKKFSEVPTSVFCYGEMISLQERMEVSLISIEDENLLAFGNLTLDAILVSGKYPDFESSTAPDLQVTEPPAIENLQSLEPSYPNPSYP